MSCDTVVLAALSAELEAIGRDKTNGDAGAIFAQLEREFTAVQVAVAALVDAGQDSPTAPMP